MLLILDLLTNQRQLEYSTKAQKAVEEVLGDSVTEMIQLDTIAVTPEKQGLGYGTILAGIVNAKVNVPLLSLYTCHLLCLTPRLILDPVRSI